METDNRFAAIEKRSEELAAEVGSLAAKLDGITALLAELARGKGQAIEGGSGSLDGSGQQPLAAGSSAWGARLREEAAGFFSSDMVAAGDRVSMPGFDGSNPEGKLLRRYVWGLDEEYHLGQLKAKLAKLRTQLLEPPKGSSAAGEGFEVTKFGHGRVALIGFPSVGKSTLLTMLTGTHSEAASYEFTTLTCIPGIIHYNDTKIQLLDLPGIIEGASEGKGRGRQVIAVAKSSDLVLMVLDASKVPPQIYFKKKKTGGISFNSTLQLTHIDEKLCYQILHEYKIHNAELLFREDATVDDLIDVIEGNRKYIKCVYVYNKIDVIGIDDVDRLARQPNSIVISCNLNLNLDRLLAKMWEEMGLVRVYTKPQGQQPDFEEPVVLSAGRGGCNVEDFCNHIHRSLVKDIKYVLVWGTSARHYPQHCGLSHGLQDEDVVQIVKKKEREDGGRGRFKSHSNAPARISDREKKAPLKT
ncbi:Developmentally-regulated GTP-binding protein 2 [Orobanche gracilis]